MLMHEKLERVPEVFVLQTHCLRFWLWKYILSEDHPLPLSSQDALAKRPVHESGESNWMLSQGSGPQMMWTQAWKGTEQMHACHSILKRLLGLLLPQCRTTDSCLFQRSSPSSPTFASILSKGRNTLYYLNGLSCASPTYRSNPLKFFPINFFPFKLARGDFCGFHAGDPKIQW